jgi:hypothetical protein
MAGAEWKEPKQDVNYLSKSSSRKGSREVREIAKRLLKSTCSFYAKDWSIIQSCRQKEDEPVSDFKAHSETL